MDRLKQEELSILHSSLLEPTPRANQRNMAVAQGLNNGSITQSLSRKSRAGQERKTYLLSENRDNSTRENSEKHNHLVERSEQRKQEECKTLATETPHTVDIIYS